MALTRATRIRYGVVLAVIVGAVVWLVAGPLTSNIQYFRPVSEALEKRADDGDRRIRLMGEVVAGTVTETERGVEFDVTDGEAVAHVVHEGDPPQLFAGGVPVVCEGRWRGERFDSDRIMIRHGNEYSPPEVTTTGREPGAA